MSIKPNDEAHQYFIEAYKLMQSKSYRAAYPKLKKGLELDPSSSYGRRYLGYVTTKLGRHNEAADQYQHLLQDYGCFDKVDEISVFTPRSDVLMSPKSLARFLDYTENVALALFAVAWRNRSKGIYRQSLSYLESVLKHDPDYSWLDVIRAWCLIELGDYSDADAILNKWIRFQPEMPRIHFVSALLHFRRGHWINAARSYIAGLKVGLKYHETDESAYQRRYSSIV